VPVFFSKVHIQHIHGSREAYQGGVPGRYTRRGPTKSVWEAIYTRVYLRVIASLRVEV